MTNAINFSRPFLALVLSATSLLASANEGANPLNSLSCKAPEYDSKLVQADEKGVVKLRFTTDAKGKVLDAKVEESSGFTNLDRASITALKNCRIAAVNNVSAVNNVAGVTGDSKLDDKMTPESQASRLVKFHWVIN